MEERKTMLTIKSTSWHDNASKSSTSCACLLLFLKKIVFIWGAEEQRSLGPSLYLRRRGTAMFGTFAILHSAISVYCTQYTFCIVGGALTQRMRRGIFDVRHHQDVIIRRIWRGTFSNFATYRFHGHPYLSCTQWSCGNLSTLRVYNTVKREIFGGVNFVKCPLGDVSRKFSWFQFSWLVFKERLNAWAYVGVRGRR